MDSQRRLFGVGFELSTALDTKVRLHEVRRGSKERKKHGILNIRVGKRSTRGTRHSGGEESGEKKRVSDDVSDVAHERPFIRPQRDIYWGKRERDRAREKERERHRKGKRDDQTRIM